MTDDGQGAVGLLLHLPGDASDQVRLALFVGQTLVVPRVGVLPQGAPDVERLQVGAGLGEGERHVLAAEEPPLVGEEHLLAVVEKHLHLDVFVRPKRYKELQMSRTFNLNMA